MDVGSERSPARRWVARLKAHLAWRWMCARQLPGRLLNQWLGTLWYDLWLKRKSRISRGLLTVSERSAVYVLYPRLGLQASHLDSLEYLVRKGFAPLVVSNLPLSPDERERLLPLCWSLLERPNYGYDFGAYRDGVLFAISAAPNMRQLLLANDSAWFPIPAASDWIAQAERLDVDLAGAVSNDGWVDYLSDAGRGRAWIFDPFAPRLHYCSFALLLGSRVLRNPDFRQFWRSLKLTSNKMLTIHRGEVGLSRWIIDRGYSHAATLDLKRFDQDLDSLDTARLYDLVAHLIIPEDVELRKEQSGLTAKSVEQSDPVALRQFILWAATATGPAYALPHWSLKEKGFGFLKKSPMWLSEPTARITLSLVERYGDSSMLKEAKQLARDLREEH
jgi:Rhamnan synthesis protein F